MFEKCSVQDTVNKLKSDEERGLAEGEAFRRLQQKGRNELREPAPKTWWMLFAEQLNDALIYVLLAAAAVSLLLGEVQDTLIIGVVVLVNAVVGMIQEGKAIKALDALKKLTSPTAIVVRDGAEREVPAAELVPGDLVCLETGCQVPADIRLVESASLKVEESALTGESLPVEKDAGFLTDCRQEIPLGDRYNMVFMSTMVTYGRARGLVTATGMDTEIGKIADMITTEHKEETPLQKRLGELGKYLSLLSVLLCLALFLIAVVQHRNLFDMLLTAISLAVAAVPEGLPAVVTICLAMSVTKMVKVHTIVRRLPSVETLGAVSAVCSDKTGTLTQNRMTVEKCWLDDSVYTVKELLDRYRGQAAVGGGNRRNRREHVMLRFLQGMVLCNDATIAGEQRIGDPTELALLELALQFGIEKEQLQREYVRCSELAFDSDRKMMTTGHLAPDGTGICFTKGAPDMVLKKCSRIWRNDRVEPLTRSDRDALERGIATLSAEALRILAVAVRTGSKVPLEDDLILLGLVGMKDPVRPEAAEAVGIFRQAGVETVMITGDHVDTALAIGRQLGIVEQRSQCMTGEEMQALSEAALAERLGDTKVFARVSPAQKVQIVKGLQQGGRIVAMTGDGVNDAPSLKAADIGIAMGMNGTDVAKQAADMILTDDNFATIEKAIEEGRGVYENIRKSVIFLLSSNLGEILTMFLAVLGGLASPLRSCHILWINLITDSLPALALGMDKNDGRQLMTHPPRKAQESLFSRGGWLCTGFYGLLIAAVSLTAFLLLPYTLLQASRIPLSLQNLRLVLTGEPVLLKSQTYAFTVLGMSQLFHAVGMRDTHKSVFSMKHYENLLMIGACMLGIFLQVAVTEVPFLTRAFQTSPLSGREWMHLAVLASFPMLAHECIVLVGKCRVKASEYGSGQH